MCRLYNISLWFVNPLIYFLIVILLPGLPPRTTFPFKEFSITPTKELKGALEPNNYLDGAERLLDGRVYGPECLIVHKDEIYMGIHGGEVIKLSSDHVTHVTKIGQPCEDIFEESRCGRPLGLAFDAEDNLIIADTYYGIWQVNLKTNKKTLLISPNEELPGETINRKAKTFNSLAIDRRGNIYWTDSSSDFELQDLVFSALVNPSGRLFKYDRVKNESVVLVDELFFANGLALSPDEDFIVVAETGAMRLTKYYISGPKAGKKEVFVEGLPGHPDNLTPDSDGIWVPLVVSADSEHPSGFVMFSNFPRLRLFFARVLSLIEMPLRFINNMYPNRIIHRLIHFIGHGESILILTPDRATIVRVDWHGNIVGSLHGFDKSVRGISHVLEFKDYLFLGSPFNRYLARIKSPKAGKQPVVKVKNIKTEGISIEPVVGDSNEHATVAPVPKPQQKPITTTASPPTTTAKPTTTTTTTTTKPTTTTTTTKPPTTTTTTKKPETQTVAPPTKDNIKKPSTVKPTAAPTPRTPPTPGTPPPSHPTPPTRVPPKEPAPIKENLDSDTAPPKAEKLKVISKKGAKVEL